MTIGFADVVLDFFNSGEGSFSVPYGGQFPGGIGYPTPVNTSVVLGDDPNPDVDFLSLPTGSFVTVGFTDETVIDRPGNDIFIREVGSQGERANVFVSSDFVNFTFLGIAQDNVTTAFDLASIGFAQPVRAVRIVGLDNFGDSPGFDVVNVQGLPGSFVGSTIITDSARLNIFVNILASAAIGFANGDVFQLSPFNGEAISISEQTSAQFTGGVLGTSSDDFAIASAANDVIYGGGGADSLNGGEGEDLLFSGDGNDRVFGGQDDDIVNGNQGDDNVSGDRGNDLLRGGKGDDMVTGGDGEDVLVGDLGIDTMMGGGGADAYLFRTDEAKGQFDPNAADYIFDFNALEGDRIGLTDDLSLDALSFGSGDVDQDGSMDTVVRLGATNEVLGVVLSVSSVTIQTSFFTVTTGDPVV